MEQGLTRTTHENVIEVLTSRFGSISPKLVDLINQIDDLSVLKQLFKQAITIESLTAFEQIDLSTAWLEQKTDGDEQ